MSMFNTWKILGCFAIIAATINGAFLHLKELADMAFVLAILAAGAARMACEEQPPR